MFLFLFDVSNRGIWHYIEPYPVEPIQLWSSLLILPIQTLFPSKHFIPGTNFFPGYTLYPLVLNLFPGTHFIQQYSLYPSFTNFMPRTWYSIYSQYTLHSPVLTFSPSRVKCVIWLYLKKCWIWLYPYPRY